MGKASRRKKLQRQQAASLEQYGGVKLSDELIEVCEPFDYDDISFEEYEKLISMAVVAWNISIQAKEKRAEELLRFIDQMPGLKEELETDLNNFMNNSELQDELPTSIVVMQILRALIQRKDELYPNDDRVIMDFKLTETPTERHLSISSLIPNT
jgi:hypothetical protein